MADIKLLPGTRVEIPMPNDLATDTMIQSSVDYHGIDGATDDTSVFPDELRVDAAIGFGASTTGAAVNIYLAGCNAADGLNSDGTIIDNRTDVSADELPNLGVPIPVISQGGLTDGGGVFRATKAGFRIVVENASGDSLASMSIHVTPLNYNSA